MAIRTSDITPLDLSVDAWPPSRHHHVGHSHQLLARISVIEFKKYRVRGPAINARMCSEVAQDLAAIHLAPLPYLRDCPSHVIALVRDVVGVTVSSVAVAAIEIQRTETLVGEGERFGRLHDLASRTTQEAISTRTHGAAPQVGMSRTATRCAGGGSLRTGRRTSRSRARWRG